MKLLLLTQLLAALLFGQGQPSFAARLGPPKLQRVTVYVFLAESCPISQQATLPLRELHARYAARGVRFVGVFPGSTATAASVAAFARTYAVPFAVQLDPERQLTQRFKATTTPEAVVVAADGRTVRYQGRLDDQYAALGERRSRSQHHELAEALADLAAGRAVAVPRTEAVGCFIEL
ncbi:MAG: redoxin domain-containing protein [Hymenobacter sp.]|nr:MAG: redoxin domain-containing protein [Hymenobacter sp.]